MQKTYRSRPAALLGRFDSQSECHKKNDKSCQHIYNVHVNTAAKVGPVIILTLKCSIGRWQSCTLQSAKMKRVQPICAGTISTR